MNRFTKWFLRNLCEGIVSRGWHKSYIIEYYKIMNDAARKRFTEDNEASLNSYLIELHNDSLKTKVD